MEPNLDDAVAILEDEMRRWTTPDEIGVFRVRPESLLEVAAAAGAVEGRRLNDGRVIFTLAGRICRAYQVTISLRTFLAGLAHRVERLNYPEPNQERVFRVDPYGFEAEVNFPLRENEYVHLYVETCNGLPKIAQTQAYWFLITRQDFTEVAGNITMSYQDSAKFRATTGLKEAFGTTPQEAVTALMQHLSGDAFSPITIWPYNMGDAYFSDAQQARLQELKGRRETLTVEERAELEGLIEAALDATIARTKALTPVKS